MFALPGASRAAGKQRTAGNRAPGQSCRQIVTAVMPVWSSLELIRDQYSAAGKGEVVVTGIMLVGDVVLLREDAFVQDSYRLA